MTWTWPARHSGWCEDCGARFGVGDLITGGLVAGYRHQDCEPSHDPAPARVCDRCWLLITPSGACGCEPT